MVRKGVCNLIFSQKYFLMYLARHLTTNPMKPFSQRYPLRQIRQSLTGSTELQVVISPIKYPRYPYSQELQVRRVRQKDLLLYLAHHPVRGLLAYLMRISVKFQRLWRIDCLSLYPKINRTKIGLSAWQKTLSLPFHIHQYSQPRGLCQVRDNHGLDEINLETTTLHVGRRARQTAADISSGRSRMTRSEGF